MVKSLASKLDKLRKALFSFARFGTLFLLATIALPKGISTNCW